MEKVVWLERSNKDLIQIYNYINKDSIYYSKKTIINIINSANDLMLYPYMGRKIPEYNDDSKRELIYKSYRIMYTVKFNEILINRVWHSSRLVTKKLIS